MMQVSPVSGVVIVEASFGGLDIEGDRVTQRFYRGLGTFGHRAVRPPENHHPVHLFKRQILAKSSIVLNLHLQD